jgi:ribosomal protein S18 acetylase RimI-like enzyme
VFTLRPATPADAPTVARVWRTAWLDGHLGHVPDALLAARDEGYFADRAERWESATTVAVGPDILGLTIVIDDELVQLAVRPESRRLGVGGALLAAAEADIATRAGQAWLAVVAGNVRAQALYRAHGWRDTGELIYDAPAADGTVAVPVRRFVKDVRSTVSA